MQKGYKREGRAMAVLRCFIGLFILIVVVLLAYFMLRLDYSDKLEPGASMRPYVEVTATPMPTSTPEATAVPAILNNAMEAASATATATATVKPTAAATAVPTAEPTAEPTATPEPTAIPESVVAPLKFSGFELPELSAKTAQLGVTHSYRSIADDYRYLHLKGYACIDEAEYDGAAADLYLVIVRSTGHTALALPTKVEGASGMTLTSSCTNAAASDFDVVIDVSKFPDDSYTLGMVFMYKDSDGKTVTEYCTFPAAQSFSVLSGQVISDVKTVG